MVRRRTTDAGLIDQIEAIRARNNTHWMDLVRLAVAARPTEAKRLLRAIARHDGQVRTLTQRLGRSRTCAIHGVEECEH